MRSTRILILAPHTDDGELGCGGTIARLTGAGHEIYYVAFSTCSKSLPKGFTPDTLSIECRNANAALGVKKDNIILFDFEVRELAEHRQRILEELLVLNRNIQPHHVYLPARNDIHQDHHVIHQEGMRAFRTGNVFGYELPWNNTRFEPNFFQQLSESDLSKKVDALKSYRSQSDKRYMDEDFIRSLARVRGVQAGCGLAEAFEVYKLVE